MSRLIRFWVQNITGTIIDTVVLFVLSRFIFKHEFFIYYIAPIVSFEFAVFNNFNVAYHWVWGDRNKEYSGIFYYLGKFVHYNLTCVVAFLVKMLFLILTLRIFHLDIVLCNIVGLCFSGLVNYFGGDKVVFAQKFKE